MREPFQPDIAREPAQPLRHAQLDVCPLFVGQGDLSRLIRIADVFPLKGIDVAPNGKIPVVGVFDERVVLDPVEPAVIVCAQCAEQRLSGHTIQVGSVHIVSSVDNRAIPQVRVSGRVDGVKEALLVKRILHLPVVVPSLLRAAELGRRRSVYNGVPLGAVLDRGAEIPLLYWSSTYFSWTLLPIARNGSKSRKKNPPINMIAPSTTPIIPPLSIRQ